MTPHQLPQAVSSDLTWLEIFLPDIATATASPPFVSKIISTMSHFELYYCQTQETGLITSIFLLSMDLCCQLVSYSLHPIASGMSNGRKTLRPNRPIVQIQAGGAGPSHQPRSFAKIAANSRQRWVPQADEVTWGRAGSRFNTKEPTITKQPTMVHKEGWWMVDGSPYPTDLFMILKDIGWRYRACVRVSERCWSYVNVLLQMRLRTWNMI